MSLVRCILCKAHAVPVNVLICDRCRRASSSPDAIDRIFSDLQQHRLLLPYRFSDSKKFVNRLRAAAHAAGFSDVHGPAHVGIVGQMSVFQGSPLDAYHFIADALEGLGFGPTTDVWSVAVSLTDQGNSWTSVEVRALLDDELRGRGGVMMT